MCGCDRDGRKTDSNQKDPHQNSQLQPVIVGQPGPTVVHEQTTVVDKVSQMEQPSLPTVAGSSHDNFERLVSLTSVYVPEDTKNDSTSYENVKKDLVQSIQDNTVALSEDGDDEIVTEMSDDKHLNVESSTVRFNETDDVKRSPNDAKRYLEINVHIGEIESVLNKSTLILKEIQVKDILRSIVQIEKYYAEKKEYIDTFKANHPDLPFTTIQEFFRNFPSNHEDITTELEEFLDTLNEEDIMKQKILNLKAKEITTKAELKKLKENYKHLLKLYKQEDALLEDYFSGLYGSEQEHLLENEVEYLLEKMHHIQITYQKWRNAYKLVSHAIKYLEEALIKWDDLSTSEDKIGEDVYWLATETRNSLLNAAQNIHDANRYLVNINFPYCTPAEVETLIRAITHIYTDVLSTERWTHARLCYYAFLRRCVVLHQWFDKVLKTVIKIDFITAAKELRSVERDLRNERVRLIVALGSAPPEQDKSLTITESKENLRLLKTINIFLDYESEDSEDEIKADEPATELTVSKDRDTRKEMGDIMHEHADVQHVPVNKMPVMLGQTEVPQIHDDYAHDFPSTTDLQQVSDHHAPDFPSTTELQHLSDHHAHDSPSTTEIHHVSDHYAHDFPNTSELKLVSVDFPSTTAVQHVSDHNAPDFPSTSELKQVSDDFPSTTEVHHVLDHAPDFPSTSELKQVSDDFPSTTEVHHVLDHANDFPSTSELKQVSDDFPSTTAVHPVLDHAHDFPGTSEIQHVPDDNGNDIQSSTDVQQVADDQTIASNQLPEQSRRKEEIKKKVTIIGRQALSLTMAEIPSFNQLFPSLDKLTKDYDKFIDDMQQAYEKDKTRVQMEIDEKIANRKTRAEMMKREMEEFGLVLSESDDSDEQVTAVHTMNRRKKSKKMSVKLNPDDVGLSESNKKRRPSKIKQEAEDDGPSMTQEKRKRMSMSKSVPTLKEQTDERKRKFSKLKELDNS